MPFKIFYTSYASPVGTILLAATEKGVCRVAIGVEEAAFRAGLKARFEGEAHRRDGILPRAREELNRYFKGRPVRFTGPFDLRGTGFQVKVWRALRTIPHGEVRTYGEVAVAVGAPKACRAVGGACGRNPLSIMIPCHRVVASGGGVGGFGSGIDMKLRLLKLEGFPVSRLRRKGLHPQE